MRELIFKSDHWGRMYDHVISCLPEEACGLIIGTRNFVEDIIPVTNRAHSPVRYEMDPKEQLIAFKRIDELQLSLLAIYHSHPDGPAYPSRTDIETFSYPDTISVIWHPVHEKWDVNAYKIRNYRYFSVNLSFPDNSNL
jgi:proteasome lid subunit RPN8/RPN11